MDYDPESDSLAIFFADRKSSTSIENGDIVIDIDYKKNIVGIELLNATKILSYLTKQQIVKDTLERITDCALETKQFGNNIIVKFALTLSNKKIIENTIAVPIMSGEKLAALA